MRKLIVLITLLSQIVKADCTSITKTCDKALADQQTLVKKMDVQISNLSQKSALDDKIISDQNKELNSPLHDPVKVGLAVVVLTIAVGVLTGHVK